MAIEVKVPVLPESVADATVDTWHKQPGDTVRRDENLVDLETDKVVLEVPAPRDGVLGKILKPAGETVTSDEVLATIEEGDVVTPKATSAAGNKESARLATSVAPEATPAVAAVEPKLSRAVERLVAEHDLNPAVVPATGRRGRLTRADVLDFLEQSKTPEAKAPAPSPPSPTGRPEERVPMSRLRARIAERMVEAQQTAAILTSFNEVDLKAVMDLRRRYKEQFEKQHDTRLGLMSFFVKACVEALKKHPAVNASVDGNDVIYHGYYDIGIAVSTERGLVVPIVRDANAKSFADIEREIRDFAERARQGGLTMEDLTGGTFSITNGGVFGSLVSTPILNPPQSAILGMHAIKERPVVVDGEIVARPMMYLALSYDHRLIDGKDAVLFLVAVKDALEDPARLLLQL